MLKMVALKRLTQDGGAGAEDGTGGAEASAAPLPCEAGCTAVVAIVQNEIIYLDVSPLDTRIEVLKIINSVVTCMAGKFEIQQKSRDLP